MLVSGDQLTLGNENQGCFYCGAPIERPFIEWHGQNANRKNFETIHLHPECCLELTIRLLRDFHEWECRFLKNGELRLEKK